MTARPDTKSRKWIGPLLLLSLMHACVSTEPVRPPAPAPARAERIDVISCRVGPGNEFVEIRYRRVGAAETDSEQGGIYLRDEATGRRFYLMRLERIGRLAEIRNPEEGSVRTLVFRNIDKTLRFGSKVTLVIGTMRKEHLVLGK